MRETNTYYHNTNDIVAEGHSTEEYAEKQRKNTLEKAGSVDIEAFMESLDPTQKCTIEVTEKGRVKAVRQLETDHIYTVWYDEPHNRWCYMSQNTKKGAMDEHI